MKFNQTISKSTTWIVLTNDLHYTTVRLRARQIDGQLRLTPNQVRHARKMLCGFSDCTCGNWLGCRGRQAFSAKYGLILTGDGFVDIIELI